MNAYPEFVAFFIRVAKNLKLLGRESGRPNLFFIDGPEQADTLLNELKSGVSYPFLMVEYHDEDKRDESGKFTSITSAFLVIQKVSKKTAGDDSVRTAIYEEAKPAADQILAYMQKLSDRLELKLDKKVATLSTEVNGNWVGPLHSGLYGWRYEFTWRVAAGVCYNPDLWEKE